MKILITGDRGFLGRHFITEFKSRYPNCEIFVSNTETNNLIDYPDRLPSVKLDFIYHFAAWTKAGDFCLYHPAEQWTKNQYINTNIINYWKEYQPSAVFVGMGTSCAYDPELVKSIDNYGRGNVDDNLYSYAMTKRMLFDGMKAHAKQFDMKYQLWIPTTLCGPDFDLSDSHFIFDLVKKIVNAKVSGDQPVLWGDGHQLRELMYVRDAINCMLDNINLRNTQHNLSTGVEYSIRDYAEMICRVVDYDSDNIVYDEDKFVGVRSKKIIPSLNYPNTKISKVIEDMVRYYEMQIMR
jgi:GDP-L-fucose synthase